MNKGEEENEEKQVEVEEEEEKEEGEGEGLREYFTKYGDITEVMVMKDPTTRRSRGKLLVGDHTAVSNCTTRNFRWSNLQRGRLSSCGLEECPSRIWIMIYGNDRRSSTRNLRALISGTMEGFIAANRQIIIAFVKRYGHCNREVESHICARATVKLVHIRCHIYLPDKFILGHHLGLLSLNTFHESHRGKELETNLKRHRQTETLVAGVGTVNAGIRVITGF
ncbi:hypothetical protein HZH68_000949 [Vespula germanica]|uniref:RRM domain-containing protein n=1 Tax=Vespula germanica TaxID=30212 RepID=A0A834NUU8_VESGE|nr:hypothetical protein HZH68_000949 [Vespula germanica]